jgi:hypothetical protein
MPRLLLQGNNVALMDAYHEFYTPKVLAFFMQLSTIELLTLSVPPAMEHIKRYKLKKDG